MLERIFLRERKEEYGIENERNRKVKIGVISTSYSSGNSLISVALAEQLSYDYDVSFVEVFKNKKACVYDMLGMDRRFIGKEFKDVFKKNDMELDSRKIFNIDSKINWIIPTEAYLRNQKNRDSEKREEVEGRTDIEFCSIVNNIKGNIIICDIDYSMSDSYLINEMDKLVVIIDPMPDKLLFGIELLKKYKILKAKGKDIVFIVNKYNKSINDIELNDFLGFKNYIKIPMIAQEIFFEMQYNCKLPYENLELKKIWKEKIEKIQQKILN